MPPRLWPHHHETVARLRAEYEHDPRFLGLIIGGSLAKGYGRADSDVDFMLVGTDEEVARRTADIDLPIIRRDLSDYEGGYVDGKVIDLAFLREVAERGSEPARSAFLGAWVEFSRDPEIADVVARIPVYPEEGHEARLRAFYSHARLCRWYVGEAVKHGNRYLLSWSVTQLSLYSMRAVLAHNRRIYPYHKWVVRAVEECADQPEGFLAKIDAMLADPTVETSEAVMQSLETLRAWDVPWNETIQTWLEESEWNWRSGPAPLPDR